MSGREEIGRPEDLLCVPRGMFRIVRVNGTILLIHETPTLNEIRREVGADVLDVVSLGGATVMLLDDQGVAKDLPDNEVATRLMRNRFGEGYPHTIRGDVVIVNDDDFPDGGI